MIKRIKERKKGWKTEKKTRKPVLRMNILANARGVQR